VIGRDGRGLVGTQPLCGARQERDWRQVTSVRCCRFREPRVGMVDGQQDVWRRRPGGESAGSQDRFLAVRPCRRRAAGRGLGYLRRGHGPRVLLRLRVQRVTCDGGAAPIAQA